MKNPAVCLLAKSVVFEVVSMRGYAPVRSDSQHGSILSSHSPSDEAADDEVQKLSNASSGQNAPSGSSPSGSPKQSPLGVLFVSDYGREVDEGNMSHICRVLGKLWGIISFAWMRPLLETGSVRRLEPDDLYELAQADCAKGVFDTFSREWKEEVRKSRVERSFERHSGNSYGVPSLSRVFFRAFGSPFIMAGGLKLVHDTLLFSGPYLLNKMILFLSDPSQPKSAGFTLVFAFFITQSLMSLCLRQYFWWCYRVGMRLRSAVITCVFVKSTAISMGVMSRHSVGEITNLMSVDSTRMQDLTPYLHACWYSFYQLGIALYFLSQQLGWSTVAAVLVVVAMIPVTKLISSRMKQIQTRVSKYRDERVKVVNEVLSGMKVIKIQAWESQFIKKIQQIRALEMEEQLNYAKTQALSGFIFSSIPQLVAVVTFFVYIMLGNQLDAATALTSFALFDLLRFPLFMLPTVINNIVEASITVERIQKFLVEPEMTNLPTYPLRSGQVGVIIESASTLWEGAGKKYSVSSGTKGEHEGTRPESEGGGDSGSDDLARYLSNSLERVISMAKRLGGTSPKSPHLHHEKEVQMTPLNQPNSKDPKVEVHSSLWREHSDAEYETLITRSIATESELRIIELEQKVSILESGILELNEGKLTHDHTKSSEERRHEKVPERKQSILTLSRISLRFSPGEIVALVGHVGCGKSSLLSSILGDLRIVHGVIARQGRVAYVAQRPFIANATLKENILFGLPFDQEMYQRALFCCALGPDLEVLPGGDETEIGERGINLSGGQKARVGLARAFYANADIYLLDDPLAAVDTHVGVHIFEYCIMRLQEAGKATLLVTNALHLLRRCTSIVMMNDGRVSSVGTYDRLVVDDKRFRDMVQAYMESSSEALSLTTIDPRASDNMDTIVNNSQSVTSVSVGNETGVRSVADKAKPIKSSDTTNGESGGSRISGKLVQEEEREHGDVSLAVYTKWGGAAGGTTVMVQTLLLLLFGEGIATLTSWWLTYWSDHGESGQASQGYFLAVYAAMNAATAVYFGGRDLFFRLHSWEAGVSLFLSLLSGVMFAPMAFYDTTPLGRILNRFSKDTYSVDEQIPNTIRWYISSLARVSSAILYICIVTPLFILGLIPILVAYVSAQKYYIKTSRELSRLDSISRSPIYALFSETLDGLTTIRAFGSETRLITRNFFLLDKQQRAYFLVFSANCWLGIRLELVGTFIVTLAALFAVLAKGGTTSQSDGVGNGVSSGKQFAGLAGLSISLALSITQSLNWSVRMASDLESQMVSVERISEYSSMDQEQPHFLPNTTDADLKERTWPQSGRVVFEHVNMRYRPGLPLVLQDVNISINAGERIGIVGRTGSGKSTLTSCLLRLVELEENSGGRIMVDDVDIASVGIYLLRSAIAVIAQDPVLFSGTLRTNLDPFQQFTDDQLNHCVQRTQITLNNESAALDSIVEESGANFSVGQRQLICIARAMLCGCRVVILDEATASVDVETDTLIQKYFREGFHNATVLTIAHRLNTIMDSDRILVMDGGKVAEFDTPANLLKAQSKSIFRQLVNSWEASK